MKILLYEPGVSGHCQTILNYVISSVRKAGWEEFVIRKRVTQRPELNELRRIAKAERCDLIHILTADGCGRRWILDSLLSRKTGDVPIIATYYLFTNLYTIFPGCLWDWLFYRHEIQRVLISDEEFTDRPCPKRRRKHISYLPDPWDPDNFEIAPKNLASKRLELNPSVCRFLLFGDLSRRKGVHLAIRALAALEIYNVELLLVGEWNPSCLTPTEELLLKDLVEKGKVVLRTGYVQEELVGRCFSSADYVLCLYPKWFRVSSGTFTRACAAGRLTIAPENGVVGTQINKLKCGFTYESESLESLINAMRAACISYDKGESSEAKVVARKISSLRTLAVYSDYLTSAYDMTMREDT